MCSWCWAFRPTLDRLFAKLPSSTTTSNLLGGLAPDTNKPMDIQMRLNLQATWRNIQTKVPETQFNYNFWAENTPRRSTYPACRAVIAARKINKINEDKMIFAIQQAYYLRALNPSDNNTLIRLATEINIDKSLFESYFYSDTIASRLLEEIQQSRSMGASSFPSLIMEVNSEYRPIAIDYHSESSIIHSIKSITN
ncbi:MAG: DsbA family protein [Candidatus Thiodiazotropha sp.]